MNFRPPRTIEERTYFQILKIDGQVLKLISFNIQEDQFVNLE